MLVLLGQGRIRPLQFWVLQLAVLLLSSAPLFAAAVSVNWNASGDSSVTGYKIYYGTSAANLNYSVSVGNVQQYNLSGLALGQTYYFAVTAYTSTGDESNQTSPVSIAIPSSSTPTPTPTPNGIDSDGDGISDSDELLRGTNPSDQDSDNDGVNDGQEIVDGTNPVDRGSGESGLGTKVCSEWNGFLGGLWNVLELINMSNQSLTMEITLYGQSGLEMSHQTRILAAGDQQDALVHDFLGWQRDSYGVVCVQHSGMEGDLDGRMVYYKPASAGKSRTFDFAFAMPFTRGKRGMQYVSFNTYQPSLKGSDQNNLVANWIQLTNVSNTTSGGYLSFYGLNGVLLNQLTVNLAAGGRQDFSAHQLGRNLAGFVRWEPMRSDLPFQLRNVRYLYDNAYGQDSFATAFQLEGMFASGEEQSVPVSTENKSAIVEVSNVLNESVTTSLSIYNEDGALIQSFNFPLSANSSLHFILDSFLGQNKKGTVRISANRASSIMAVAMHYGRMNDGAVNTMYGIPLKPAFGTVLRGSYNTFLGQTSYLLLENPTSNTRSVTIDMRRSSGVQRLAGYSVDVPAHGMRSVELNLYEGNDTYGVVTVHAPDNQTIVPWVIRTRPGEFAMPVPVRE